MNPYMAYNRIAGPGEGAMLVFAPTAQRARIMSYGVGFGSNSDWIDWVATRIKDLPEHLKALHNGGLQVIECPPICKGCESWGGHPRGEDCCSFCYESYALDNTDNEEV